MAIGNIGETVRKVDNSEEKVSFDSLEKMTGFPASFIKSELLTSSESVSIAELRKSVLNYLEANQELLN